MPTKCKSCGGVYEPIGADGTQYFHACAPVHRAKVKRADGSIILVDLGDVRVDDERLDDVLEERADKRDENVVPVEGKPGTIKLAGKGTEAA
jgi:hypothetical protein